ncbi:MAG: hypothetical protein ACTHN5_15335 [Phycisphaerae bacterium]
MSISGVSSGASSSVHLPKVNAGVQPAQVTGPTDADGDHDGDTGAGESGKSGGLDVTA